MMMKKLALCCLTILLAAQAYTQTLFTYGKNTVSKEEFLRAFNKNATTATDKNKALQEYLDLYTRFRLKVKAAYDLRLDTLPNQQYEMTNFRNQVVDSYINNDNSFDGLVEEAFVRLQKDIHLGHIFIALSKDATPADTLAAYKTINEAYAKLKSGQDFGSVAVTYSTDPSAKTNKGDLGYITAFSLPYDFENIAYTLPEGSFSRPSRSKIGYHIFKVTDTRKAFGRLKAAQILLAFPPDATDASRAEVQKKADSIYNLLIKGEDFNQLVTLYSNDNTTSMNNGELPEFGVGKYETIFENAAFSIPKDGALAKPFTTAHGYHIVKRLEKIMPLTDRKDVTAMKLLRQQVVDDSRVEKARSIMLNKILAQANFKRVPYNEQKLWILTDSAYEGKRTDIYKDLTENTSIFTLKGLNVKVGDWLKYSRAMRSIAQSKGLTYADLFDQYIQAVGFEYYRNHLEDYNLPFRYQLQEFKDGNLLFEVMQRKIWSKAAEDSSALVKYYNAQKNKYKWEPSADAMIFTCVDGQIAKQLREKLQANPGYWEQNKETYSGKVQVDSGRFELPQIPASDPNSNFAAKTTTGIVSYPPDSTAAFAYIITLHSDRSQRSFEEAKGFVINDYQLLLEEQWIAELKKKYPVKINEAVLKGMLQ
jgi:peptidyl-prolyl cis-trans isomerase SurA